MSALLNTPREESIWDLPWAGGARIREGTLSARKADDWQTTITLHYSHEQVISKLSRGTKTVLHPVTHCISRTGLYLSTASTRNFITVKRRSWCETPRCEMNRGERSLLFIGLHPGSANYKYVLLFKGKYITRRQRKSERSEDYQYTSLNIYFLVYVYPYYTLYSLKKLKSLSYSAKLDPICSRFRLLPLVSQVLYQMST